MKFYPGLSYEILKLFFFFFFQKSFVKVRCKDKVHKKNEKNNRELKLFVKF